MTQRNKEVYCHMVNNFINVLTVLLSKISKKFNNAYEEIRYVFIYLGEV